MFKTIEFKLYPNQAQSQTLDQWLDMLKWVWNRGLSLRFESQQRRWRAKHSYPIPDSLKLKWKKGKLVGAGVVRPKKGYPFCPIREHRNIENIDNFLGCKFFNLDNAPDFLSQVPAVFKSGVADALKKSWKAYSDPKHPGRKPRFKRRSDKLKSLRNLNAGGTAKNLSPERIPGTDNGYISIPKFSSMGLGKIRVKGLYARHNWNDWGSASIVKEPSGYYLHVLIPTSEELPPTSDRPVGIDPGLISIVNTDQGKEIAPPKIYRKSQKRLRRLQRSLARRKEGGSNYKKLQSKINLCHEKIRRSRNAFNHKVSSKIVQEYGAIAMEDLKVKNLMRRPKPKAREDGNGYEQNGAKRKTGLNKSFADSALGDLIAKIESKCNVPNREFVKVPAHYTTINCYQCGTKVEKSLSQRTHRCPECGYIAPRDKNAAENILEKGRESFQGIYRTWLREVKLASVPNKGSQQESAFALAIAEYAIGLSPQGEKTKTQTQKPNKQRKKKRTSGSVPQTHTQLTLWEWGLGEGGEV